jgi:hypothetical protein
LTLKDIADIVVALAAFGGFLLSLYNFFIQRRAQRPTLTAKVSSGLLTFGPNLSDPMLLMEVANPGDKKVVVSGVEIPLGQKKMVFPKMHGTKTMPFELHPGENASFWTPLREFAVSLKQEGFRGKVKVRACFRTAVGQNFFSRANTIDVDEWSGR